MSALASFLRFVVLGGGVGVLSSFAVPQLTVVVPWAVANAVVTVVSTLLCTELHARLTFRQGRGAGWREHWQSAGSAGAAYLATSAAMFVLHLTHPASGALTEQAVYLGASGLAGLGRFVVLRIYVFATTRPDSAVPQVSSRPEPQPSPAIRAQRSSTVPRTRCTALCPAASTSRVYAPSTTYRPRGRFPSPMPTSTGPRTFHNCPPSARSSTIAVPLTSAS
ncbi:GtrA family protein [Streptomyces sp. 4F14]|uniref:GtrA family protein n=1 Tax=Streptomyces sp. 4F14 TaxID=3394380 RepID=UPI003A8B1324